MTPPQGTRLERGMAPAGLAPTGFSELVQVAGVHDMAEALLLREAGVHAVGLPLRLPVNAEDLTEDEAARLIAGLERLAGPYRSPGSADTVGSATSATSGTPAASAASDGSAGPYLAPVGITYIADGAEAARFCRTLGLRRLQLHGPVTVAELARLRAELPDLFLIKSLVVRATGNLPELLDTVRELSALVDAFITDTHDPATGADGATGRTHDWSVSAALVRHAPRPLILAGGLTPDNVRNAILHVRPAGVDAHTGVEGPDGRKCPEKLRRFVAEARAGFAALRHAIPDV